MSRETPSKKTVRTKWVPKIGPTSELPKTISRVGQAGIVVLLGLLTIAGMFFVKNNPEQCSQKYNVSRNIYIGGHKYLTEVANTDSLRQKGLSGRKCIPSSLAMLFEFGQSSKYGIWMKDMKFAIDIVWLAEDKTVVYLEQNIGPDTYPKIFTPTLPSKYVVEIKSGQAEKLGLKFGDRVSW